VSTPAGNTERNPEADREALAWQLGVWDEISRLYAREVDKRFAPVVEEVITRVTLQAGQRVLDLGTGTGSVAIRAATLVAPGGQILGVDLSAEMLAVARRRVAALGLDRCRFQEGRGEAIPADAGAFDVLLASLSLMYVIDRAAAAHEIARVLRPGGRFVAAVWAGPEQCDIVLFQQTAGRFAPPPPIAGVGPGALADPRPFLAQLADAGITAAVETEVLGFDFENFTLAWDVMARVTTSQLAPERQRQAKAAVLAAM
jgi:SAM-dependent methyltransferase